VTQGTSSSDGTTNPETNMKANRSIERILIVDDERAILDALRRAHGRFFDLVTAQGAEEGLQLLEDKGPFAVVVSDYTMPKMNGAEFLRAVCDRSPNTVRVMLTGNTDMQSAIDAVNEGHIFQFLSKPCDQKTFKACLEAALEQYRLRQAEQVLLEQTVRGSIEVLADVLALSNPEAFGRASRVRSIVKQVVERIGLRCGWEHETAALLSQIGFISVPPDVIERLVRGESLSEEYEQVLEKHPQVAKDLLGKIPRLERVAEIVAQQRLTHAEAASTDLDDDTALSAQVLAAALDFDELSSLGAPRVDVLRTMKEREGAYDPRLLQALAGVRLLAEGTVVRTVPVTALRVGMVLDQDVATDSGLKIVGKGNRITPGMLARLQSYGELGRLSQAIRVRVSAPHGGAMGGRVA